MKVTSSMTKIITLQKNTTTTVSLDTLELFLSRRVHLEHIAVREDAHFLNCASMAHHTHIASLLGVVEDESREIVVVDSKGVQQQIVEVPEEEILASTVEMSFYKAVEEVEADGTTAIDLAKPRPGPHSEWEASVKKRDAAEVVLNSPPAQQRPQQQRLQWIDLRDTAQNVLLTSQADVVQLYRSVLGTAHEMSPWAQEEEGNGYDIVVLALPPDTSLLDDVRVSDVSPSWFLHAELNLVGLEEVDDLDNAIVDNNNNKHSNSPPAQLYIYKKLGPRTKLMEQRPGDDPSIDNKNPFGCLWEAYTQGDNKQKEDGFYEHGMKPNNDAPKEPQYRLTSPPYLDLFEAYANMEIPELFLAKSIQTFREDALSIPQWTPWPESVHYKTSGSTTMPWTVFPLCHCFPADAPDNLSWIDATKSFVPRTCQLLQDLCGGYLRTALFSQLAPNSVLEAHTGWADLANHVLRLHIPLVVPDGDLCGTWVDGCVETHAAGRPLLFDDSKIHRAFNYSCENRIVLIVDLARPDGLPPGYAEGGHTEELDAFIQQMSLPK